MVKRRDFLKTALIAGAAAGIPNSLSSHFPKKQKSLIKPPALKNGDTIGLITPGSPPFETGRTLIEVREKMQNLGFKVKVGTNVTKKRGYLAGTVQERVADIHAMFSDDEVKALVAIRGGYGSAHLLPHLDYDLIANNPKILLGYSDITSLLIGIYQQTGLITFHGPVAISTFTDYTKEYFYKALTSTKPVGEIADAPFESNLQTSNRVWTYRGGTAKGKLIGGTLTLLQATIGTPWEFDSEGAILFFEDIGEEPYDIDRVLTQFKQAGKFDKCRGVVFDKMKDIEPADYKPAYFNSLSVEEIINDVFKEFDFPVCLGVSIGHIKDKPTLPIGIMSGLDADKGRLSLLEAAVS